MLILPHMSTLPRSKPPQAPRLNIEVDGSDRADNIADGGGILKELEPSKSLQNGQSRAVWPFAAHAIAGFDGAGPTTEQGRLSCATYPGITGL